MWWKIYFWVLIILTVLSSLYYVSVPSELTIGVTIELLIGYIALVGLYSFLFKKQLVTTIFWKYFFVVYLLLEIASLIKLFLPDSPLKQLLGYLSTPESMSIELALMGFALEIPLLFALYQLAKSNYYTSVREKAELVITKRAPKWGMVQTALWGYTIVFTFLIFLMSFIPGSSESQGSSDISSGFALFAPLLLFWLFVIGQYKYYQWNWWRTTLVANSLFYSGLIFYGLFTTVQTEAPSKGFDIIGILQICILFLSLLVFGKDQFVNPHKNKTVKDTP